MDTYKEKQTLDDLYHRGDAPWVLWNKSESLETSVVRFCANGSHPKEELSANATRQPLELVAQANS
jgi:hypothetical protein